MTRSGIGGALSLVSLLLASLGEAQPGGGAGLVLAVLAEEQALELETREGAQRIRVPATASMLDDHGRPLGLGAVRAGDAVSYQSAAGTVIRVHVARQFWAVPGAAQ